MKNKKEPYRHGDIGIKPFSLPSEIKKVFSGKSYVLAEGETTGHRHVITAEREALIEIHEGSDGRMYMSVLGGPATITHEEHKPITVLPGTYKIGIEKEHDYFKEEVVRVQD